MIAETRHRLRFARFVLLLGLLLVGLAGTARAATPRVVELVATGTVDGAMASYLAEGIAAAADEGATAVVVRLDTPGGTMAAMDEIKQTFLEAPLPVIVWVAPSGARAASAGTFITLAAHLSYMAPATNIGAASPVAGNGEDIPGVMGAKVLEDAIASIAALAEARGRPVEWAVSTVEDARSYTASEAVAAGAVDGIAATMDEVLAQADGRQVEVFGTGTVTLELTGAEVIEAPMNPFLGIVHLLSDPNLAFLLFVLGVLGLATELIHPNLITGVLGAFALLLSFVGFGSLPLNLAGVLLLVFGFVLFVLETQIVSHGLLTVGGLVCVALGASMLYTAPMTPSQPAVQVAPAVLAATLGTLAALMVVITVVAIRTRRMKGPRDQLGSPVPAGSLGTVQAPLDPLGTVYLSGEVWTARTPDERALPRDAEVRLVGFDGLTAIVEPVDSAAPDAPTTIIRPPVASPAADRP